MGITRNISMNYVSNGSKDSRNINDQEGGDDINIEVSEYARRLGELQLNEENGAVLRDHSRRHSIEVVVMLTVLMTALCQRRASTLAKGGSISALPTYRGRSTRDVGRCESAILA
jgi:hypothetical protein